MVTSTSNSKTFLTRELSKICHIKCEKISNEKEKSLCEAKCDNPSQIPETSSKMSEKLTDIANNLRFESVQLSCIADEIDDYNSMSI